MDWLDNSTLYTQAQTTMLRDAREYASKIARSHPGVKFVGHSLGGRLANNARLATGNDAIVFNSSFSSISDHLRITSSGGDYITFRSADDPVSAPVARLRRDIVVANGASHSITQLAQAMLKARNSLPLVENYLANPLPNMENSGFISDTNNFKTAGSTPKY